MRGPRGPVSRPVLLPNPNKPMPDSIEIQPVTAPIDATITLPGSKSITNRALLLAALAEGWSRIEGALFSDDTRVMSGALNQVGIPIRPNEELAVFEVDGAGGRIPADRVDLFLGNAGTATRFLTAALSLLASIHVPGGSGM